MKISEAFEDYRKYEIIALHKSTKTYENYIYAEKSLKSFFGDINIKKISPESIAKYYIESMKYDGISSDTARGYIICLRSVLKRRRACGDNLKNIELVRIPQREKKRPKCLDISEVRRFIETVATPKRGYSKINRIRNTLLIELLFVSGIRISEACALNRDSIKNKQFCVVGKSKQPRPCYINERVEELINDYLSLRNDISEALFVNNQTGTRMTKSTAEYVFRRVCNDAKIYGVHPHTMRHSFATYLLEQNVSIENISNLLGHQNLNTTQVYTHIKNERLRHEHQRVMA